MYIKLSKYLALSGLLLLVAVVRLPALDQPSPFPAMRPDQTASYAAKDRRDPFVQPRSGRLQNVMENVNIENLRLTGVIRNSQRTLALFASRTGPQFGYLLKDEKLYRENQQPVPGITGKVYNPKKVILKQGDRQIIFTLR